jgi:pyruvate-ferredoxin/flavodoxin oxidoreductase
VTFRRDGPHANGFVLLASNSVQEAQDMAAIASAATLAGRIPVLRGTS